MQGGRAVVSLAACLVSLFSAVGASYGQKPVRPADSAAAEEPTIDPQPDGPVVRGLPPSDLFAPGDKDREAAGESSAAPDGQEYSLRFYGNGVNAPGLDRVTIQIEPHRPVDVGGDFTIEWWMKALAAENTSGNCSGGLDTWVNGNIILDRDINGFSPEWGDWGISLYGGRIAFGTHNGSSGQTICGNSQVADGEWHHVAVTRRESDGQLMIFIDGVLDRSVVTGVSGDISYRDGSGGSTADRQLVVGAEKGDFGPEFPSYSGFFDELRVSTVRRYTSNFTPPTQPFTTDADTVGLYHLNEGSGNAIGDTSGAAGGPSDGIRRFGGDPAGPVWSTDVPWGIEPTFPLDVDRTGSGSGTVTSNPAGIDCGIDCSEDYPSGTLVELTPQPDFGSTFAGWSGDADCVDGEVTMSSAVSCTAQFDLQSFQLTVTTDGTGGGVVTSLPAGIDCGVDCSESYPFDTDVTLTAAPDASSQFVGWSGDPDCSDGSVSMTTALTCTATFHLVVQEIFADDFECGCTTGWSETVP